MIAIRLVIIGAPRTKKNHGRVIQRGKRRFHVPSEAHEAWATAAVFQLQVQARRLPSDLPVVLLPYFTAPVNLCARIYRDADRGDAVGYYQAIADVLEDAGIVANDRLIASWDGTRLYVDRRRPRVEIDLSPLAAVGLSVADSGPR